MKHLQILQSMTTMWIRKMKNAMGAKEMHINTRDMVHMNVDNLNFSMHVQNIPPEQTLPLNTISRSEICDCDVSCTRTIIHKVIMHWTDAARSTSVHDWNMRGTVDVVENVVEHDGKGNLIKQQSYHAWVTTMETIWCTKMPIYVFLDALKRQKTNSSLGRIKCRHNKRKCIHDRFIRWGRRWEGDELNVSQKYTSWIHLEDFKSTALVVLCTHQCNLHESWKEQC